MRLEYIHARYLGWENQRSVGVSMCGYIGPAKEDIKEATEPCLKGNITRYYRLQIKPDGECWVPDLTKNRLRLKKRVEQGLFQILDKTINLDEKSPCDELLKVSAVEKEKEALLQQIADLKKQVKKEDAPKPEEKQEKEIPELELEEDSKVQAPKVPIKRRRRKPKIDITPDME